MVHSRVNSSETKVAALVSERTVTSNVSGRTGMKQTSIEGELTRRKKMGAEELRLSRVDVRERQKRFEKMANTQDLRRPRGMERSRSEENRRINSVNIMPRGKSESVDRITDVRPKLKKMNIVATSSKRNSSAENVRSTTFTKKQDNNTPKAWVQPLKRESIEASDKNRRSAPLPVKEKVHLVKNAAPNAGSIPMKKEHKRTEQETRNLVSNSTSHDVKPFADSQSLNRSKSQSMTITIASRQSRNDDMSQKAKKPVVRVNSKASEKSNKSAKIFYSHHERPEHEASISKTRDEKDDVRRPHEDDERKTVNVKDRRESRESTSSYYREVRENFRDRKISSNSKNELLADIMSVENYGMAKALGLSEELIDLIKEEEQFWNRQIELKRWRESQEKKYRDISRVYDNEKEKRIAELRKEHEKRKSARNSDENYIEKMRVAEENLLAEEAERLIRMEGKQKGNKKEKQKAIQKENNPPSSETQRKVYLRQYSFDKKTLKDQSDSKVNNKRYSYPPPSNNSERSNERARYSDVTHSNGPKYLEHPKDSIDNADQRVTDLPRPTSAKTIYDKKEERKKKKIGQERELRSHGSESGSRSSDHISRQSSRKSRHSNPGSRSPEKESRLLNDESRQENHEHIEANSSHSNFESRNSVKEHRNVGQPNGERDLRSSSRDSFRRNHNSFPENQSGLDHLTNERVFSEQCDGKVRTYHVTSVAVRYSRASSSSSSNLKSDKSVSYNETNQSQGHVNAAADTPVREANQDSQVREKPINHVTPIGWFSDDDDVFIGRPNTDIVSPRGCFSDGEMTGEYFRENLYDPRRVRVETHQRIRCVGCNSLIREIESIGVIGKDIYWHDMCFVCVVCGINLLFAKRSRSRIKVRIINDRLHCASCYSTNGDKLSEV